MSPHLILILMLSSVAILLVLFFVIRGRNKKAGPLEAPQMPTSQNLSGFHDIALEMPELSPQTPALSQLPADQKIPQAVSEDDIIELVSRYKFFQGENLETFSSLLKSKNFSGIENLILEKFLAQGKPDAGSMAKEVSGKLLAGL